MERCFTFNLFLVPNLFFPLGLLPDFHLVILFALCLCIIFFFWRQISIGYFPGFGDLTEGARQEFRDSRGVKAHLYARAPPPLG